MFKCLECGHIFDQPRIIEESRGECFGYEAYERIGVCPVCGGEYDEGEKCEICGEIYSQNEIHEGVCDRCIDNYRHNFDLCYKLSLGHTTPVYINELLASLFEPGEIDQILKKYILTKCKNVDCSEYIDCDIDWFSQKLLKEVKR